MFKKKTWEEVRRIYTPPVPSPSLPHFKAASGGEDILHKILNNYEKEVQGFTTVELRCVQTGEIKFIVSLGDQTK